jgi:predicted RNA-binding protein YlxR (DUF448 family)
MMMSTESAEAHNKRERTCVGCAERAEPNEMVRLVLGPNGEVAADAAGGAFGRGAHVHPALLCITNACKFGLARSFKAAVKVTSEELSAEIAAAYMRRAEGLLLAAKRAKRLTVGADETLAALVQHPNATVVIANDAASVVKRTEIASAIAEGRACTWTNKAGLGRMLARDEVAVCAVIDVAMAEALRHAVGVASAMRSGTLERSESTDQNEDRVSGPTEDVSKCLEER